MSPCYNPGCQTRCLIIFMIKKEERFNVYSSFVDIVNLQPVRKYEVSWIFLASKLWK
jgi:hypothetical protein